MKREDIGSSLFWLAISVGIAYEGYHLKLGTVRDPGSGFIFFWLGLIMAGLSLGIFIQAMAGRVEKEGAEDLWTGIHWSKLLSLAIALLFYVYAFTSLGFIISTILLLTFLFKVLGPQPWLKSVIQAVISTLVTYFLFGAWLGVQFPLGMWGIG